MDLEAVENELLALMARHGIPHLIVVLREGENMCLRVLADNPIDAAGGKVTGDVIEEAMVRNQAKINNARLKAAAQNN